MAGYAATARRSKWVCGQKATSLPATNLTDNDLLADPELSRRAGDRRINEVTVVYKDQEHHFNDYTQVYRDPNNFRLTGGPRPETYHRPWLTDATLAKTYARRSAATTLAAHTRGDLTVKREWLDIHSMLTRA